MNLAGWFCPEGWRASDKHANRTGRRFSLFAEASASFKLRFGFGHKNTAVTGWSSPCGQSGSRRQTADDRILPQAARLLGIGPVDVVRSGVAAVLPDLVRSGRTDHHGVVREIELDGRSPGVHDLALVVLLGIGGREDDDLAFGLAGQGRRDLGR